MHRAYLVRTVLAASVAFSGHVAGADAGKAAKPPAPRTDVLNQFTLDTAIKRHNATRNDIKGFVAEIRSVGPTVCKEEESDGSGFPGTDAVATRVDREVTALRRYNSQLKTFLSLVKKAKLPASTKDRKAANADLALGEGILDDVTPQHDAEFDKWDSITVAIRSHACDSFASAVQAAADAAESSWNDEAGGLFRLERALDRVEGHTPSKHGTAEPASPYR
ncbi:MAG: hypothetical protein JWM31_149 [Solirubrobacterales bacterium]|nr:hypothetical protein [Solirubrobacterales bacterium]